nr:YidC/Oxa1 family membrane protein insertase [Candidatus Dojkabacteria bacterium]
MDFIGLIFNTFFNTLFYQPIYNLLMFLYSNTGGNLGVAIIIVALIVKLITIPLTKKQLESGKKMKIFQEKTKAVKEKFKKNKEKMNEELMKLTSEYMPAQLSGCLPLIISIIFLIQVRNVVVNLVNQGYESFNEVAYTQSLKFDVDSVIFQPKEDLKNDENTVRYVIKASNGKVYDETIVFVKGSDQKSASDKAKELEKSLTKEEKAEIEKQKQENRKSDIAIHAENFDDGKFVTDPKPTFKTFLRPPSNETVEDVTIELNGKDITKDTEITKGEKLNLNFFGMDLSKVGTDYI